jgi:hypothetical protein
MHATDPDTGLDGFRMFLYWKSRGYFLCRLEYRSPDKKRLDHSNAVVAIKFCPWCGVNLKQHYAPADSNSSSVHLEAGNES